MKIRLSSTMNYVLASQNMNSLFVRYVATIIKNKPNNWPVLWSALMGPLPS